MVIQYLHYFEFFLTHHYLLETIPYQHIKSFLTLFVLLVAAVYSTVPSNMSPCNERSGVLQASAITAIAIWVKTSFHMCERIHRQNSWKRGCWVKGTGIFNFVKSSSAAFCSRCCEARPLPFTGPICGSCCACWLLSAHGCPLLQKTALSRWEAPHHGSCARPTPAHSQWLTDGGPQVPPPWFKERQTLLGVLAPEPSCWG